MRNLGSLDNHSLYRELIEASIAAVLSDRDRTAKLLESHASALMLAHERAMAVTESSTPSEERLNLGLCRAMAVALLNAVEAQLEDESSMLGVRIQTGAGSVTVDDRDTPAVFAARSHNKRLRVAGLLTLDRQMREEIAHAGELMAHDAMRDQRDFAAMPAEGE
jgi:hypothetical protein